MAAKKAAQASPGSEATADPKKREKRWYTRPEDHAGPQTAVVGAGGSVLRVSKGQTFQLATTVRQHEQMLAERYKEATKKAVKEETAPVKEEESNG